MPDILVRNSKKPIVQREPLVGAPYSKATAGAIQALAAGTADADQQKRALDWIMREACRTYDTAYFGERAADNAFVAGQRFSGGQIVAILNTKLGTIED